MRRVGFLANHAYRVSSTRATSRYSSLRGGYGGWDNRGWALRAFGGVALVIANIALYSHVGHLITSDLTGVALDFYSNNLYLALIYNCKKFVYILIIK